MAHAKNHWLSILSSDFNDFIFHSAFLAFHSCFSVSFLSFDCKFSGRTCLSSHICLAHHKRTSTSEGFLGKTVKNKSL